MYICMSRKVFKTWVKSFWRSSQNNFVLALFCSLHMQLATFLNVNLAVENHKTIVKSYQFKSIIDTDAVKLTPYIVIQQYIKQNLLNFRQHFLFAVPSKISSF